VTDPVAVAERFLAAFNAADTAALRDLLAPDVESFVTDASGGERRLEGADAYVAAVEWMDLPSAEFSVVQTQPAVTRGDDVLVMVEVHASRGGRTLHNFAAHLLRVQAGRITEMRMVEAKPAESDAFWSAKQ
jgi:ketosteroid isomerase-like protein